MGVWGFEVGDVGGPGLGMYSVTSEARAASAGKGWGLRQKFAFHASFEFRPISPEPTTSPVVRLIARTVLVRWWTRYCRREFFGR